VHHTEESDIGAEVLRLGGNIHQGRRAAAEEQVAEQPLVLKNELILAF